MGSIRENNEGINLNGDQVEVSVQCSICLGFVNYGEERSRAKLQCGHEFHLDCIGSAFNMQGTMQCPDCHHMEQGQWLFAGGANNSSSELGMDEASIDNDPLYFGMDEASIDNDPIYFGFTEMPSRVNISPFRGLRQAHPSLGLRQAHPSRESILGLMRTIHRMVTHQHPGVTRPHPHGWPQFHHAAAFQLRRPLPHSLPLPVANGPRILNAQRSLHRFVPPREVYEQSGGLTGFAVYGGTIHVSYSRSRVRDNITPFSLQ